ncbi:MAG: serine/threonine protein kinase [Oscillospiraceae bacterium]|nr:serine/threonine protein kinase [Oscillospiraceae bacterium]
MAKFCPYCVSKIEMGNSCPYCNYARTYRPMPHHLRPGTLLHNKYLVGRVLGEGGYGITYVGRDLTLDMKVAIKEYYPNGMAGRTATVSSTMSVVNWSFDEEFKKGKEQFIYEAQNMAKLDKESAVVTVRDFFEENNSAYIVMEFVEGQDLRTIIRDTQKPMDAKELLPLIEPLFSALGELHNLGLIHRDISPDNIMIENGRARLIDFGCAKETIGNRDAEAVLKHSFSPVEQYENRDMGPWTDVYAMAATIYYCITGRRPPKATDRLIKDELASPNSLGAKLSAKQERALMKALAIRREDRYQSMQEFGKDLFVHRNIYKRIAIAAVAVALLATSAFLLFKPDTQVEVRHIKDSNTVTQTLGIHDDGLSKDEMAVLEQMTEILKKGSLSKSTEQHSSYYVFPVTNETEYKMDNMALRLQLYNNDGAVIENTVDSISEWESGSSYVARFYYYGTPPARAEIRAVIKMEDTYLQTDYIDIPLSIEDAEIPISLTFVGDLPKTVSYQGYNRTLTYSISSFTVDVSTWYGSGDGYSGSVYFGGTYESGPDNDCGYVNYRVTDASGVVYDSGTVSFPKMSAGERFENSRIYISGLTPGDYYLELTDYSY